MTFAAAAEAAAAAVVAAVGVGGDVTAAADEGFAGPNAEDAGAEKPPLLGLPVVAAVAGALASAVPLAVAARSGASKAVRGAAAAARAARSAPSSLSLSLWAWLALLTRAALEPPSSGWARGLERELMGLAEN